MSRRPLAFVDAERQVRVIDGAGRALDTTGEPSALMWGGSWQSQPGHRASYSWPTWSPDGRHLALFRLEDEPQLVITDIAGVVTSDLVPLGRRMPIYLRWSPDGQRVAFLTQRGDRLYLSIAAVDQVGQERVVAEGSPLFFTWLSDGRLAVFVNGGTPEGRLSVVDPVGGSRDVVLPHRPGNFCAPVYSAGRVVYVAIDTGPAVVVDALPDGGDPRELYRTEGLVAMIASPDDRYVAVASAPNADGAPYRGLTLIDRRTGAVRPLSDTPCLAFLWVADGTGLALARVDTGRNVLAWSHVSIDGDERPLGDLEPTRELSFYLRFFEQYTDSHPLVDSGGLLVAGELVGRERGSEPRVWCIPLEGGPAEVIGSGRFAVYGPK